MDYLNDIISAVAVIVATVGAWFARKALKATPRGQRKSEVVSRALVTARKNPSKGVPLEVTALEYAILIDMEDGKSDFTREALWAEVRVQTTHEKT